MTNNIEQIEELLQQYMICCLVEDAVSRSDYFCEIMDIVTSMQSQIDALTKEADADESRESESL